MAILLMLFAILAGMALPTQFSVNAQLRTVVGSPIIASAISFMVGAVALIIVSLFGKGIYIKKEWFEAPWWMWTGGLLGASYVLATTILMPRIGAAATVGYILAGQVVASILIDHFGLIGAHTHALSFPRLLGALLVIGGIILVQKF
ncbi:DMT family transporter [Paenibacillus brasilensis]|uniref:Transporter family-2 protein n=1 Tax=Paenibacillus brasilensis TaxID=128574 RepID=A0ABU0L502_9BACL|nr:DMT family transporter [Paenibacillus brasilensis]MDQ0496336.1 transporter family-2 protein [Paenibacillus brasilensis]